MNRPTELDNPLLIEELRKSCRDYLDYIKRDGRIGEDYDENYVNDIFEKAIETVYPSETIWDYINEEE